MGKSMLLSLVIVGLVGCGGRAVSDAADPGTGGAAHAGSGGGTSTAGGGASSAGTGGSASGSGTGGASSGGAGGACTPIGDGWSDDLDPTCDDLFVLGVSSPVLADDDGDGNVSPGEGFSLQVVLSEVAGEGFSMYPGVKFESSHPDVQISEDDWFYAIFACQSYQTGAHGKVGSTVAPGTVVKLTARAAMLNTECPNAPSIELALVVK